MPKTKKEKRLTALAAREEDLKNIKFLYCSMEEKIQQKKRIEGEIAVLKERIAKELTTLENTF